MSTLEGNIVYGVVNSRRLQASLGINLMPTDYKICPFNCVYCHWGFTEVVSSDGWERIKDFPTPAQVKGALESELRRIVPQKGILRYISVSEEGELLSTEREGRLKFITFSGTGEATIHPKFGEIVDLVKEVQQRYCPDTRLAILSNSVTVERESVRRALEKLDVRIMKLDAGNEEIIKRVNNPGESFSLERVVDGLKKLKDLTIQTIFMQGCVDNSDDESVKDWMEIVAEIKPLEVQIYTVDRLPANKGIKKVSKNRLNQIAEEAERRTGIKVNVY